MEEEQSLEDELNNAIVRVETVETEEVDTVTYTVMENLSQRGKPKMLDSNGFSYTVRYRKPHATYWRCAVRNRKAACGASVIQKGEDFTPGPFAHNHESKPNSDSVARMVANIKWKTMSDTSRSATAVVREVYRETFGGDISSPLPGVPKQENLARRINRWKQRMRSEESMLCEDYTPGDSDITPSMVFQYRVTNDKHSSRKKGQHKHSKRKKNKSNKRKEKRNSSSSSTAEKSRVLLDGVSSSLPCRQGSVPTMVSDVSKASSLKEIGALISERDAALRRIQEIEQILFTKYQIPVVDSF